MPLPSVGKYAKTLNTDYVMWHKKTYGREMLMMNKIIKDKIWTEMEYWEDAVALQDWSEKIIMRIKVKSDIILLIYIREDNKWNRIMRDKRGW